jgi:hypothetical protein
MSEKFSQNRESSPVFQILEVLVSWNGYDYVGRLPSDKKFDEKTIETEIARMKQEFLSVLKKDHPDLEIKVEQIFSCHIVHNSQD